MGVRSRVRHPRLQLPARRLFTPDLEVKFWAPRDRGGTDLGPDNREGADGGDRQDESAVSQRGPRNPVAAGLLSILATPAESRNKLLARYRNSDDCPPAGKAAQVDALDELVEAGLVVEVLGGGRKAVGYRLATESQDQITLTESGTGSATGSGTGSPKEKGTPDPVLDPESLTETDRDGPSETQSDPVRDQDPVETPRRPAA